MAGFAVFMTVLIYGFWALVAASVSSLCLYLYAKRRFREEGHSHRRVAIASATAPFLALLWLVAALLIHVEISNRLAHQDCGFSPDPYVTLPNGYVLGSNNTYDGYIKPQASKRTYQSRARVMSAPSSICNSPTATSSARNST